MLLTKEVEVILNPKNMSHYSNLGYENLKAKEILIVKVEHLSKGSHAMVEVLCDYCNENISLKKYKDYNKHRDITQKDCCNNKNCKQQKRIESFETVYGVNWPTKNDEIKLKISNTCQEKYGTAFHTGSENHKLKSIETCRKNYGVDYPMQNEKVRLKRDENNIKKYGVKIPIQLDYIKQKAIKSLLLVKYKNGTIKSSTQQNLIHQIIGGELNYPIDNISLDIAFPNEKIYVEFDGSGHDLSVKYGDLSKEEFIRHELKRKYYLKNRGWKEIRIISIKDVIPEDNKIIEMIRYAKDYLNTGHSWIKFNVDEGIVESSQFNKQYYY